MKEKFTVYTLAHPTSNKILFVGYYKISKKMKLIHYVGQVLHRAQNGTMGTNYNIIRDLLSDGKSLIPNIVCEVDSVDKARATRNALKLEHRLLRKPRKWKRLHNRSEKKERKFDPAAVYYVYELIDPISNEVFYVGKGSDRHEPRVSHHIREAKNGKMAQRHIRIRKVIRAGELPIMRRLAENLPEKRAYTIERKSIALFEGNLVNETSGGDGPPTGDDHWTRKYPEKLLRGDKHPGYKNPNWGFGKTPPQNKPKGEAHGMSKLTMRDVIKIRSLYSRDDITGKVLAKMFKVSEAHVSRILKGMTWSLPNLMTKHGNAKFTESEQLDIARQLKKGAVGRHLAIKYGVDPGTISNIKKKYFDKV